LPRHPIRKQRQYPVLYETASDLLQQADCFSRQAFQIRLQQILLTKQKGAAEVVFGVTITFTSLLFP
jgi:hypothetical protein